MRCPPWSRQKTQPTGFAAIVAAVASGQLTPSEAGELSKVVDTYARALLATDLEGPGDSIGKGAQMSRLADRIAKLERSRGNGYVAARFLRGNSKTTAADYDQLREQTLDEMVATGKITERQRDKVFS